MTAGGLVTASLSASSARVARRFMAPVRHLAFWVVAWSAFALAEVWVILHFPLNGPVAPYPAVLVVFRIVGGLFAACGLVAWQRRPDNHSGCACLHWVQRQPRCQPPDVPWPAAVTARTVTGNSPELASTPW
jgi:hypothetical protein